MGLWLPSTLRPTAQVSSVSPHPLEVMQAQLASVQAHNTEKKAGKRKFGEVEVPPRTIQPKRDQPECGSGDEGWSATANTSLMYERQNISFELREVVRLQ